MQLNSIRFQVPQSKPAFSGKHCQIETADEFKKLQPGDKVTLGVLRSSDGDVIRLDRGTVENTNFRSLSEEDYSLLQKSKIT